MFKLGLQKFRPLLQGFVSLLLCIYLMYGYIPIFFSLSTSNTQVLLAASAFSLLSICVFSLDAEKIKRTTVVLLICLTSILSFVVLRTIVLDTSLADSLVTIVLPILILIVAVSYPSTGRGSRLIRLLALMLCLGNLVLGSLQYADNTPYGLIRDGNWRQIIFLSFEHGGHVRAFGTTISPVYYGLVAVFISLAFFAKLLSSKNRTLLMLGFLFSAFCVYASLNRTALLMLIFGLLGMLFYSRVDQRWYLKYIPVIISLALTVTMLAISPMLTFFQSAGLNGLASLDTFAIRLQASPIILSRSFSNINDIVFGFKSIVPSADADQFSVIDNDILYMLSSQGLPITILTLIILIIINSVFINRLFTTRNDDNLIVVSFILAWSFGSMTNVVLMPSLCIIAAFVLVGSGCKYVVQRGRRGVRYVSGNQERF